ncbi:S-adenosyl-L-methionine-dependent methyltransferase [Melanogaster broomeanus]|nr:S-adenosyl-L-methionine-dependent methyltransferase [Melanogaster broomeanus]
MSDTHPTGSGPHADHHHVHSHQQQAHGQHTNYEESNRHHFNETAHQYNHLYDAQTTAQKLGGAMKDTGLFKEGVTTVMDFACGTGELISQVLAAEDPKLIVGVDISQAMVDHYNKAVSDNGAALEEMRAICVTELRENEAQLEIIFDVIVCASAYHHFRSIDEVTKTLVSYLKPGGSLLVADMIHDESLHETFPPGFDHIVAHKGGFSEADIRTTFEKAGLGNVTFAKVAEAKPLGRPVNLFLARGDK